MNLEPLNLTDDPDPELVAHEPKPFWRRQFQLQPTDAQRKFDWAFGVVLPLISFYFDFLFFKGLGLLGAFRPFAFLLSATCIMAMVAWLLWGHRVGWLAAPLSGLFIAGSFVSLVVGIVMLPLSLLGMFVVIGFLGFTPLFTGFVFLRNGYRALDAANFSLDSRTVSYAATVAAMFALVTPYVVNVEIGRLLDDVVRGEYNTMERTARKLEFAQPLVSFQSVKHAYYSSPTTERKNPRIRLLAEIYERNTGERIIYEPEY